MFTCTSVAPLMADASTVSLRPGAIAVMPSSSSSISPPPENGLPAHGRKYRPDTLSFTMYTPPRRTGQKSIFSVPPS